MRILFSIALFLLSNLLLADCDPYLKKAYSQRLANYKIDVVLDHETKCLDAEQVLTWINHSPEPVNELRFYMYQNAFKNTESTFMRSAKGDVFGDNPADRPAEDWGWIDVLSAIQNGNELIGGAKYVHPDDNNLRDETVLEIPLASPVMPGDTLVLNMQWSEKIPKIFARSGYERENFYNMVHWFPQVGVWEQSPAGEWRWNCHQFHRRTEFFGEFGNYDVSITLADFLVTGASGCEVGNIDNGNGTKTVSYHCEDVIDFAWCAYPHFEVVEDDWEHVHIRLMIAPEHKHLAPRLIGAAKKSLEYMSQHVGEYPYTSLTILDPPMLGLKSGFMEYPTYITGGSFAVFPKGVRTIESLIAHEFCHQYFMGMVATNEKEEPWMDEGFVTYHEDKIMEEMYGENGSLFNLLGYKVNNSSFSRHEYVSLDNPSCGAIARTGWEINDGFKGITYSKTATMFKTMEGMLGEDEMVKLMQSYFSKYSFSHPRGPQFIAHVKDHLSRSSNPKALGDIDRFFDQLVYGVDVLDYSVTRISYFTETVNRGIVDKDGKKEFSDGSQSSMIKSNVMVHRIGGVVLPVELRVTYEDGSQETIQWSGEENTKFFVFENDTRVVTAEIDPEFKLYLDLNLNNNSLTLNPKKTPSLKIGSKMMYWVHNLIQSFGIFI